MNTSSRWIGAFVLALLCVALAACGGVAHHGALPIATKTVTHTQTKASPPVSLTPPTSALKCPVGDITMQCVLASQPPPQLRSLAPGELYGIDFGWRAVTGSGAASIHARFGFSYLSFDSTKNWSSALVSDYHSHGVWTGAVWETSANRAEEGQAAGSEDAQQAASQAAALGMPTSRPIEFAVDCDCAVSSITPYFRGVFAVLGNKANWKLSRDGIYGGYDQVLGIYNEHLVGSESWQTYAWSNNRRLPCSVAPFYQYLNGNAFDNDSACAGTTGPWVGTGTPAKPANPHHYKWAPNTKRTFTVKQTVSGGSAHFKVHARERLALQHWDAWGCRTPVRRPKCVDQRTHMQLLQGRISHIAHHNPSLKRRVKKPRWGAVHYRAKDGHKTTLGGVYQQFARRLASKDHGLVKKW